MRGKIAMRGFIRLAAAAVTLLAMMGGAATAQGLNFASKWTWTADTQANCLADAEAALLTVHSRYGASSGVDRSEFDVRNTHGPAHIAIYCLADDHATDDVISASASRILLGIDVSLSTFDADAGIMLGAIEDCMAAPCTPGPAVSPGVASAPAYSPPTTSWAENAVALRGRDGQLFSYQCGARPSSPLGAIWGLDRYTDDSPICVAALHAGLVGSGGGAVTIQIMGGLDSFPGGERNGVVSLRYGAWPGSYMFVR